MPELPEVETTRRGVAPHVERQKVTAVRIYDRRLRWPVPRDLPRRLVGRVVDRVDRRSKYLLFRLGRDTLIVHFGMTGSLRVYARRPGAAHARSRRSGIRQRRRASLPRPAPLRRDAVVARDRWRASAARRARTRAVLGRFRRGIPVRLDARPQHGDQARADGQSPGRRRWATSTPTRRSFAPAYGRRAPPTASRAQRLGRLVMAVRETLAAAIAKGGSTLRDYVDSDGAARLLSARVQRVRSRRPALPRLRRADLARRGRRAGRPIIAAAARPEEP